MVIINKKIFDVSKRNVFLTYITEVFHIYIVVWNEYEKFMKNDLFGRCECYRGTEG